MTTHEFITLESRKSRDDEAEEEIDISTEGRGSGDEIPPPAVVALTEHGLVAKQPVDCDYRRRRPSIHSSFMSDNDLMAKLGKDRAGSLFPESHESPSEWTTSELKYDGKETSITSGYEVEKNMKIFGFEGEPSSLHDSSSDEFYEQLKK